MVIKNCLYCGLPFQAFGNTKRHKECQSEYTLEYNRKYRRNPINRKWRNEKLRERYHSDPEFRERIKEKNKNWWNIIRHDSNRLEQYYKHIREKKRKKKLEKRFFNMIDSVKKIQSHGLKI